MAASRASWYGVIYKIQYTTVIQWSTNFENASALLDIDMIIGDNRQSFARQWIARRLTNQHRVSRVVRIHRQRHICENGFRSGRGYRNLAATLYGYGTQYNQDYRTSSW